MIRKPKLIARHCGGWLAVSHSSESLRIGATGATKEQAEQEYYKMYAKFTRQNDPIIREYYYGA